MTVDRIRKRPFSFACIVVGALMLAGWWALAVHAGTVWAAAAGTIGAVVLWPLIRRVVGRR